MKKFLFSCSIILTITALAKLYSLTGHAGILGLSDPLLRVSNRVLLWAAGLLELGVVAFLLLTENDMRKCACVCCLALVFTTYRLGISWLHHPQPCPCLGSITQKLGIRPETADLFLKISLAYMLLGSIFFLVKESWQRRCRNTISN
jgi:hypothetical protein